MTANSKLIASSSVQSKVIVHESNAVIFSAEQFLLDTVPVMQRCFLRDLLYVMV